MGTNGGSDGLSASAPRSPGGAYSLSQSPGPPMMHEGKVWGRRGRSIPDDKQQLLCVGYSISKH